MQTEKIGNVQYSILPEPLFQKTNGTEWILMDGRNIEGSALHELTGMQAIPDARGTFIRSLNANRTDAKDVERTVGSFQHDGTRLPRENAFTGVTTSNGNHSHPFSTAGIWRRSFKGEDSSPRTAHEHHGHTEAAGNHNHNVSINNGGDSETRPKNIALYTYIKIN